MKNIFTSWNDWFAFYAEVDYLRRHTEFAEADIEEWFQEFMEASEGRNIYIYLYYILFQECPKGVLTKAKVDTG